MASLIKTDEFSRKFKKALDPIIGNKNFASIKRKNYKYNFL